LYPEASPYVAIQPLKRRQRHVWRETKKSQADQDTRANQYAHADRVHRQDAPEREPGIGFTNPGTQAGFFDRFKKCEHQVFNS
jgi:hypothetical protein